jgi:hypothetical protein
MKLGWDLGNFCQGKKFRTHEESGHRREVPSGRDPKSMIPSYREKDFILSRAINLQQQEFIRCVRRNK